MDIYFYHFTIIIMCKLPDVHMQFSVMNIVKQYRCVISLKDLYENKGILA